MIQTHSMCFTMKTEGIDIHSQTLHVLIYSLSGTLRVHLILIAALENSQLQARNQRLCNLPIMSQLG